MRRLEEEQAMAGFVFEHFRALLCYLDACSQKRAIQTDVIRYNMSKLLFFAKFPEFLVAHGTHSSRGTDIITLSLFSGAVSQYILLFR